MTHPALEDDIREALRHRADAAPTADRQPMPREVRHRPVAARVVAMAAAAACVVGLATIALVVDRQESQVVASGSDDDQPAAGSQSAPSGPREMPDAPVPRLGFDSPGFRFAPVADCAEGAAPHRVAPLHPEGPVLQTFGRSYRESPLLFIRTLTAQELSGFGLIDADSGDAFEVRGVTGYADRERGADRGWNLSIELPDGRAIYATVLGLELDAVITVLDELAPRAGGGWAPGALPAGMQELEQSEVADGAYYTAAGSLPAVSAGSFELNLYVEAFDQRFADRAASTHGAVEPVEVDGVPAALGSYRHDDHWVLFEPQPGRTMEIRASSMTRDEVKSLLDRAVFVDEQTWRTMCSGG